MPVNEIGYLQNGVGHSNHNGAKLIFAGSLRRTTSMVNLRVHTMAPYRKESNNHINFLQSIVGEFVQSLCLNNLSIQTEKRLQC
jgi:hypothetical protein